MSDQSAGSKRASEKSSSAFLMGVAAFALGIAFGYQLSESPAKPTHGIRKHTEQILQGSDTVEKARDLALFFSTAEPKALGEVLEAYESPEAYVNDLELILLAEWWADWDPVAAIEWFGEQSDGKHHTARYTAFRVWARSNPPDALKSAKGLHDERDRKSAVYHVLVGWDESLDTGLGEYVFSLPQGVERQEAMSVLARRRIAQMGAKEALRWGKGLPEETQFRSLMLARLSSVIAESDPGFAARKMEDRITFTSRTGLARRIATRWVRRDPHAAMAWLESLPMGPDQEDGVMEAVRDWVRTDPDEAVRWIEQRLLAPIVVYPQWLEPGLYIYGRYLISRDPRRAVEIADMMTDEERRLTLYTAIMRGWLWRDPEAAEAWIRSADLPPRVLERGRVQGRRHRKAAGAASTGTGSPVSAAEPRANN